MGVNAAPSKYNPTKDAGISLWQIEKHNAYIYIYMHCDVCYEYQVRAKILLLDAISTGDQTGNKSRSLV